MLYINYDLIGCQSFSEIIHCHSLICYGWVMFRELKLLDGEFGKYWA